MTNRIRHLPSLRVAIVSATLLCVAGLAAPVVAGPRDADVRQLDRFLWGLAGQESGWNYYARNPHSGAFGRYQVMPANWKAWARTYIGDGWLDQSPANQERVAHSKVNGLYRWLGEWRMVAYWWLTGDTDPVRSHWSAGVKRYVDNVLALMDRAPKKAAPPPVDVSTESGYQVNRGDWRLLVKRSGLRTSFADGHVWLEQVETGPLFQVLRVERDPGTRMLWLKTRLKDGRVGWLKGAASVPAAPPKVGR